MNNIVVILDNGHGIDTKGKCSPDKTLYEYRYTRDIVGKLMVELLKNNIEYYQLVPEETDIPLKERVNRVNTIVAEKKKENKQCILISVHIDAAGSNGKWNNAQGFSVRVAPNASEKSKLLAQCIYTQAQYKGEKITGNRCTPKGLYWVQNLYILKNTLCPAVLTENLFQDNKDDVQYLLSDEGKETIVQMHVDGIVNYINTVKK